MESVSIRHLTGNLFRFDPLLILHFYFSNNILRKRHVRHRNLSGKEKLHSKHSITTMYTTVYLCRLLILTRIAIDLTTARIVVSKPPPPDHRHQQSVDQLRQQSHDYLQSFSRKGPKNQQSNSHNVQFTRTTRSECYSCMSELARKLGQVLY